MKIIEIEHPDIKGWGIDADPENDPAYPMKNRSNGEKDGWDRPSQQPIDVEILHSPERPNVSAVFGTATPPSGLSGMIRRFAFRYSENTYTHWLPLILADRINVVEGILDDFSHGRIPNIFAEKGGKATWKYNRKNAIIESVVGIAVVTGVIALLLARRKKINI